MNEMTVYELFAVQRDTNKLKSLYIELANHENFNPYKNNIISDMPKGYKGKNFEEWYVEEQERILKDIELYKQKIQEDRKQVDGFIQDAPYPECDIIRFRVINDLGWFDIGSLLSMDRRTASRKFYDYVKTCPQCPSECDNMILSKNG